MPSTETITSIVDIISSHIKEQVETTEPEQKLLRTRFQDAPEEKKSNLHKAKFLPVTPGLGSKTVVHLSPSKMQ